MKKRFYTVCTILLATAILLLCAFFLYEHVQNKRLFQAIETGDYDAAQTAISRGAKVNNHRYLVCIPDVVLMNPTPLVVACKNGDTEMVKLLLSSGANVNIPDSITGKTPLLAALHGTKENRFSLAFYLIENGANIHVTLDNNSPVAECLYVSEKDPEETIDEGFSLFQYLVENGAPINVIPFNENALTYAAHYRNYNAVDYLLRHQYLGVDDYDGKGYTALIVATKYNQVEIVRLLLDYGAKTDLPNLEGLTAMDYAIQNGNNAIQEMIKRAEATPRA